MSIREKLREIVFQMTHDPNSPAGLRFRALRLERDAARCRDPDHEKGCHIMASALRKQADYLEARK